MQGVKYKGRESGRMLRDRQGNKKDTTETKSRDVFFRWAITGSKWFENEPVLKEQKEKKKRVSFDAVRLNIK